MLSGSLTHMDEAVFGFSKHRILYQLPHLQPHGVRSAAAQAWGFPMTGLEKQSVSSRFRLGLTETS